MWSQNLRNNEEGQWDTLPMTGGGTGRGPNGFVTVTLTALWSPAWGKSMVSAEMPGSMSHAAGENRIMSRRRPWQCVARF